MIHNINVFLPIIKCWILTKINSTLTINLSGTKPSSNKNFFYHRNHLYVLVIAMNFVCVVDNTTHFFNLDCQTTISLANLITQFKVDFLKSMSPDILVRVFHQNRLVTCKRKSRKSSITTRRYLKIYFTTFQYFLPRFNKNILIISTTCAISHLIHTISHTKLSTSNTKNSFNI